MKENRLIVMSADALVGDDMKLMEQLPNFKKYLAGGSAIKHVQSVYPTITYPAHTTIATGVYPNRHGINCNLVTPYECTDSPIPWTWFHDRVKVPDIFDAVKSADLTTSAVFWPVTGNHPSIDYLIDEYWTQPDVKDDTPLRMFKRSGSNQKVINIIKKHQSILKERAHPQADEFLIRCAADMIREFKPHLMMIHPANIDGYRHGHGLFGGKIDQGIYETDRWIGNLMAAAEEAGTAEDTTFILTSDHGQLEIKRVVNLNVLLADGGYIKLDKDNKVTDWDVWIQSGGMCAFVYMKDNGDEKLKGEIYKLLCQLKDDGLYGISEVFTAEEADVNHHLAGEFAFVLETDGYSSFGDRCVRPIVSGINRADYRSGAATHGYLPHKGPQPVFYAKGPAVKNGVVIEKGRLVDQAPTMAKMLGVEMADVDGEAVEEILNV